MKAGIQNICKSLGKDGCYVLCLCQIADQFNTSEGRPKKNTLDEIERAIDAGIIQFNKSNDTDKDNMTVLSAEKLLQQITGVEWIIERVKGLQAAIPYIYKIRKYVRQDGNNAITHFSIGEDFPLRRSATVAKGKLEEVRICVPRRDIKKQR